MCGGLNHLLFPCKGILDIVGKSSLSWFEPTKSRSTILGKLPIKLTTFFIKRLLDI